MSMVETKNGLSFFRFEHSAKYQAIQMSFLDHLATHDPARISHLLNMYPFHVDSLLTMSEVVKQQGDISMASILIERALHSEES